MFLLNKALWWKYWAPMTVNAPILTVYCSSVWKWSFSLLVTRRVFLCTAFLYRIVNHTYILCIYESTHIQHTKVSMLNGGVFKKNKQTALFHRWRWSRRLTRWRCTIGTRRRTSGSGSLASPSWAATAPWPCRTRPSQHAKWSSETPPEQKKFVLFFCFDFVLFIKKTKRGSPSPPCPVSLHRLQGRTCCVRRGSRSGSGSGSGSRSGPHSCGKPRLQTACKGQRGN